jgi:hypothetical protein
VYQPVFRPLLHPPLVSSSPEQSSHLVYTDCYILRRAYSAGARRRRGFVAAVAGPLT